MAIVRTQYERIRDRLGQVCQDKVFPGARQHLVVYQERLAVIRQFV